MMRLNPLFVGASGGGGGGGGHFPLFPTKFSLFFLKTFFFSILVFHVP